MCCQQSVLFTYSQMDFISSSAQSLQSLQVKDGSSTHLSTENNLSSSAVDKKHCFRMMVWFCAYYDFYDKKVQQCYSWACVTAPLTLLPLLTDYFRVAVQCNGGQACPLLPREGLYPTYPVLS